MLWKNLLNTKINRKNQRKQIDPSNVNYLLIISYIIFFQMWCECRRDLEFHLPPWITIQQLPMYHGNLSKQEIEEIMDKAPVKSYLLSNFNPQMLHGSFVVSVKDVHGVFHTSALTFTIQMTTIPTLYFVHKISTKHFDDNHKNYICDFYEKCRYPIKRKYPFSLKALARATICDTFTYTQILNLANKKLIPIGMYEYITEHLLVTKPTNKDYLFCENWRESSISRPIFDPFHTFARKRKLLCLKDL